MHIDANTKNGIGFLIRGVDLVCWGLGLVNLPRGVVPSRQILRVAQNDKGSG